LTRRLVPYLLAVLAACGGNPAPAVPSAATPADALAGFLDAVRQNDLSRMGQQWGSERGPAVSWMDPEELNKRVAVIQKYLAHRVQVVEGRAHPGIAADGVPGRAAARRACTPSH
jgi:hypothetical protein